MNYEKKTYKGFVLILLVMIGTMFLLGKLLTAANFKDLLIAKVILISMLLYLDLIAFIIYKKERVYWITTYSYEDARKMEPRQRKKIGEKLLTVFSAVTAVFIVYSIIGYLLGADILLDGAVFAILIVFACVFG
jgi:small-conductance mechanosensitive channel